MKPFYLTLIKKNLYLSNKVWLERDLPALRENHIGAIVNLVENHTYSVPADIAYLHCPFPDQTNISYEILDTIYTFIDQHCAQTRVLVHCSAGVSRSAGIVIGQLLRENPDWSWEKAHNVVYTKRSVWVSVETRESIQAYLGHMKESIGENEIWDVGQSQIDKLQVLCNHGLHEIEQIGWDSLGYTVENGRIVGLGLHALNLETFPEPLTNLTALRDLSLCENQMTDIPAAIGELKQLQNLTLAGNQINRLPPEIGKLSALQVLNVSNNTLLELPQEIGNLANLVELYLHENELCALPENVGKLHKLEELYIQGNQVLTLPRSIGKLINLRCLGANGNHIESLPNELCDLQKMRALNISKNRIQELPEGIGQLSHLDNLNISRNRISDLPTSITKLAALRRLNIALNPIHSFPDEIEAWIRELQAKGCYVIRKGWGEKNV